MRAAGVRLLAGLAAVAVLSGTVDEPLRAAEAVFPAVDQLNAEALTFEFIDKAIAEGRLKSAGDLILRADKRFPGPELMLRQAELMLAAGSFAEAATAFQKLEADPVVGVRAIAPALLVDPLRDEIRGAAGDRAHRPDEPVEVPGVSGRWVGGTARPGETPAPGQGLGPDEARVVDPRG